MQSQEGRSPAGQSYLIQNPLFVRCNQFTNCTQHLQGKGETVTGSLSDPVLLANRREIRDQNSGGNWISANEPAGTASTRCSLNQSLPANTDGLFRWGSALDLPRRWMMPVGLTGQRRKPTDGTPFFRAGTAKWRNVLHLGRDSNDRSLLRCPGSVIILLSSTKFSGRDVRDIMSLLQRQL